VMGEHSVAALQLEEVSDKVSDKGRPKGSAKCPNSSHQTAGWVLDVRSGEKKRLEPFGARR
jgi:hypothetical protein